MVFPPSIGRPPRAKAWSGLTRPAANDGGIEVQCSAPTNAEFDAILQRVQEAGLSYGSAPWSLDDGELNGWNAGASTSGLLRTPDDHLLELMTAPQ
jgi:hypothetical protein